MSNRLNAQPQDMELVEISAIVVGGDPHNPLRTRIYRNGKMSDCILAYVYHHGAWIEWEA